MAWGCIAYSINADAHPALQALEYKTLHERNDQGLLDNVFDVMPVFPERESALLKRIKKVRSIGMLDPWVLPLPQRSECGAVRVMQTQVANASADRAAWADGKDGADGKKDEESEEGN